MEPMPLLAVPREAACALRRSQGLTVVRRAARLAVTVWGQHFSPGGSRWEVGS